MVKAECHDTMGTNCATIWGSCLGLGALSEQGGGRIPCAIIRAHCESGNSWVVLAGSASDEVLRLAALKTRAGTDGHMKCFNLTVFTLLWLWPRAHT